MPVKFEDNSIKVKEIMNNSIIKYLNEAAGEMRSQAARNSRVDTGELKNSWDYKVDEGAKSATIGSPLENAIWEEFGTGEYALQGNGRKGGWKYEDARGKWHFTRGKTPQRSFFSAYMSLKPKLLKRAEQVIGGELK